MPDSNSTKFALAEAMKDLMRHIPLSKISVGDIVAHCGLNRQTFYYHFKDKYDLVNWIYYTEAVQRLNRFPGKEHWVDGLCDLSCYIRENREFYINALSESGQNSFQEYLQQFIRELLLSMVDELRDTAPISEREGQFISTFYSVAFSGMITYWAKQGMKEDPMCYCEEIRRLMDGTVFRQLFHPPGAPENPAFSPSPLDI